MNGADRDDRRGQRDVELPAGDRLEAEDDLRGHDDRINAEPWIRAVCLLAVDLDPEGVDAGHHPARPIVHLTDRVAGRDVEAEHGINVRVLQRSLPDHQLRAALLSLGRTLFRRLEEKLDGAGELVLHTRQYLGHAEENGHVRVMPAGVHDADFLAVVSRACGRLERQVDLLGDRKRVHVRAEGHDAPRLAAFQNADDAGVSNGRLHFDPELAQTVRDELRRACLTVSELGMLMDVAAAGDDLRLDLLRGIVDALVESGGGGGQCRSHGQQKDGVTHGDIVVVGGSWSGKPASPSNH